MSAMETAGQTRTSGEEPTHPVLASPRDILDARWNKG